MTSSKTVEPNAGLLKIPSCALAFSFGAGFSPWAPGSAGALVAFPLFAILQFVPLWMVVAALLVFLVMGCIACGRATQILGKQDHGAIVWDETFGMLLVLLLAPSSLWWWVLAFVAFRFFDIVKPWPVRYADVYADGGVAIMFDDILAAVYAVAFLWLATIATSVLLTG
jgi:phosphatidylglycerophosphatase A